MVDYISFPTNCRKHFIHAIKVNTHHSEWVLLKWIKKQTENGYIEIYQVFFFIHSKTFKMAFFCCNFTLHTPAKRFYQLGEKKK